MMLSKQRLAIKMTDQNSVTGPGSEGESAARSRASGEDLAAPLPSACAGSAAAVVGGEDFNADDGRKPELTPRSAADDERIALHEIGGHALMGRMLGCELGGVTCEPGPDFGGLTWGPAHDRSAKFSSQDATSICGKIASAMPGVGESRDDIADVTQHCVTRVTELVAGSVAESLFLPGEPWPAASDRAQERALASLICSSPESVEAFIGFCRAEAAALLRPREHIARALTKKLLARRTMTGREVDEVIVAAVAAKAAADERQRRAEMRRATASAASFESSLSKARAAH
jgi:hypothetical protein